MKAVLDTVIFVRALINPKSRWGRLLFELNDKYEIVLSPAIVREVLAVIHRSTLRRRLPRLADPVALDQVLALLEEAEIVEPTDVPRVCRDAADDKFFACAAAGQADFIVSEDQDILAVGEYRGVKTQTAEEFVAVIENP